MKCVKANIMSQRTKKRRSRHYKFSCTLYQNSLKKKKNPSWNVACSHRCKIDYKLIWKQVFPWWWKTIPTEHFHCIKRTDCGCAYSRQEGDLGPQCWSTFSFSETKPGAIKAAAGRVL